MTGKIRAWLTLARLPFHAVGILPFILGVVLAWRFFGVFRWEVFLLSVIAVILIMLSTYFAGEYWDFETDMLSAKEGASRFAGGSQVLQNGLLPRRSALYASLLTLSLAILVGAILFLLFQTGVWTIPLGFVGIIGGFFYSAKPIRWVSRGVGELWIAFNYGWLTIATALYLQIPLFFPLLHFLAVPVGLTIFNVILLNEFLDFKADKDTGKNNLVVRLGLNRSAAVYVIVAVASWCAALFTIFLFFSILAYLIYLPVFLLSLGLVIQILRNAWQDRGTLEALCGLTILVNLGTTLTFLAIVVVL